MGILDKLMFWKKKDEFSDIGLGDKPSSKVDLGLGLEYGTNNEPPQSLGLEPPAMQQPYPQMQPPSQQMPPSFGNTPNLNQPQMQSQDYAMSKNLEVVSSKLDALRAALDSINQRLANLEAIARGEEDNRYKRRW